MVRIGIELDEMAGWTQRACACSVGFLLRSCSCSRPVWSFAAGNNMDRKLVVCTCVASSGRREISMSLNVSRFGPRGLRAFPAGSGSSRSTHMDDKDVLQRTVPCAVYSAVYAIMCGRVMQNGSSGAPRACVECHTGRHASTSIVVVVVCALFVLSWPSGPVRLRYMTTTANGADVMTSQCSFSLSSSKAGGVSLA